MLTSHSNGNSPPICRLIQSSSWINLQATRLATLRTKPYQRKIFSQQSTGHAVIIRSQPEIQSYRQKKSSSNRTTLRTLDPFDDGRIRNHIRVLTHNYVNVTPSPTLGYFFYIKCDKNLRYSTKFRRYRRHFNCDQSTCSTLEPRNDGRLRNHIRRLNNDYNSVNPSPTLEYSFFSQYQSPSGKSVVEIHNDGLSITTVT